MSSKKTKHATAWMDTLIIIAATALVAGWLVAPKPPISPTSSTSASNNEITHQVPSTVSSTTPAEELAAAQRVCASVNKLMADTGGTITPPLTVADCIAANQDCEQRWGAHSVWAGSSDANNLPTCSCDEGYQWLNNDGTIGTSYGPGENYDFISGPGRCIARQ